MVMACEAAWLWWWTCEGWLSCEEFSCACEDASDRGPTRLIGPNKVIELS